MFRRRAAVKEAGCRMQEAGLVVSSSRRALRKDSRPLYHSTKSIDGKRLLYCLTFGTFLNFPSTLVTGAAMLLPVSTLLNWTFSAS